MSHQEPHGGIIVNEGDERPSHLNIEGHNAQHTTTAGEALSGESSNSDTDEKKGGGKPVMEKYAYHSMSPFTFIPSCSPLQFRETGQEIQRSEANEQYSHPRWLVYGRWF
jgi:hypothetical protein